MILFEGNHGHHLPPFYWPRVPRTTEGYHDDDYYYYNYDDDYYNGDEANGMLI